MAAAIAGTLVALAVSVVGVALAMTVRVGLETAADAAALAAVVAAVDGGSPAAAAAEIAARNGAELSSCRCPNFDGVSFSATVVASRAVHVPLLGARVLSIERSAEYVVGSTVG
jgi:hypothetical protein